jgi:hypothetical protein
MELSKSRLWNKLIALYCVCSSPSDLVPHDLTLSILFMKSALEIVIVPRRCSKWERVGWQILPCYVIVLFSTHLVTQKLSRSSQLCRPWLIFNRFQFEYLIGNGLSWKRCFVDFLNRYRALRGLLLSRSGPLLRCIIFTLNDNYYFIRWWVTSAVGATSINDIEEIQIIRKIPLIIFI